MNKPRYLILDAALAPLQVGLLIDGRVAAATQAGGEALEAIFEASAALLRAKGLDHNGLDGYIFGAGPGTLLGLRLAAMAIEGWRSMRTERVPVRQYITLSAAAAARANTGGPTAFDMLVPVRRGLFARVSVLDSRIGPPELEQAADAPEAPAVPRYHLPVPNRRLPPPPRAQPFRFDLRALPEGWFSGPEVTAVDHPAPYNPSPAVYAEWTGGRHRG
ncbi:MAG: hypothetical protein JJU00_17015 [Opitutales bacterium]|nr:hypothetical protein [Opitutales bacterium]